MSSMRKTVLFYKDGDRDIIKDDWRSLKPKTKQRSKWKGYSVLEEVANSNLGGHDGYHKGERYSFLAIKPEAFAGKKMGSDEVAARDILPQRMQRLAPSRR